MIVFILFSAGYSSAQTTRRWFFSLWKQRSPNVLNGLSHPQKSRDVYLGDRFPREMAIAHNVSQDLWGDAYAEHPLV